MYEACVLVDSLIENLNTLDIQSIYTEAVNNTCNSYNIPLTSKKCIVKLPNHLKDFFVQQTVLSPQSQYFLKLDILNSFASFYECNLVELENELKLIQNTIELYETRNDIKITNILWSLKIFTKL